MKKRITILSAIVFAIVTISCSTKNSKNEQKQKVVNIEIKVKKELITFNSSDDLTVSADLYTHENRENDIPFIILFHQAGYSRGEYNETADKFLELGFNCLAVDQRSGNEVNDIANKTNKQAVAKGLNTEYIDAMPDLLNAISYVRSNYNPNKLIILGSSYSSVLSLIIASQYPDSLSAVLAFSPGEYFKFNETTVKDYASEIEIPVFITSAKSEYERWSEIYEGIPEGKKFKYVPEVESIHGSRALWITTEGSDECWEAVEEFLTGI